MKLSLIAAAALAAHVAFAENAWTYYAAADAANPTNEACIVRGDWIVAATYDAEKSPSSITLGVNHGTDGNPDFHSVLGGSGDLDLRDLVVNGNAVTNVKVCSHVSWGNELPRAFSADFCKAEITSFKINNLDQVAVPILNGLSITNAYVQGNCTKANASSNPDCGFFRKCMKLETVVVDCPLKSYGAKSFSGCTSLKADIADLVPPSVESVDENCFVACGSVTGSLTLTNLTSLGKGAFAGVTLDSMSLAGPIAAITTSAWGGDAQHVFGTVKTVVLDLPNLVNCTNACIRGMTSLTILGSAENWRKDMLDYLLGQVAAVSESVAKDKGCVVYCSKKQGWKDFASAPSGEEVALSKAVSGCFGVYESETAVTNPAFYITSVGRKAWMVHLPQDSDPVLGALLIVR